MNIEEITNTLRADMASILNAPIAAPMRATPDLAPARTYNAGVTAPDTLEILPFLNAVVAVCELHGYVSTKQAAQTGQESTAKAALAYKGEVTEAQKQRAIDLLSWGRSYFNTHRNGDYERTMGVLLNARGFEIRAAAYIASLVGARKNLDKPQGQGRGRHRGTLGESLTCKVTLDKTLTFDGTYGPSHLHLMRDEEGNRIVWSTGTYLEPGTYALKGTVKKHDMKYGENQTVVTRCRVQTVDTSIQA